MVLSLVIISIILILLLFLFMSQTKGETHVMAKFRNIYLYLVSFVSLMMILIGIIVTVQNVMDVVFPTTYINYEVIDKSNEMTPEERAKYEAYQIQLKENQIIGNKKNVAKSVTVVVVALPVFLYHWKKIQQERNETPPQDKTV